MIKNIIVINDFAYVNGGAAKIAINSSIGLKKAGYNVLYFTAVGEVCTELIENNIEVISIKDIDILNNPNKIKAICNGIWNKRAYKKLIGILKNMSNLDTIVHIHGWSKCLSASIIKACEDMKFKFIFTAHDYFSICPNGGLYNYKRNQVCKLKPLSIECLVCNCDSRSYFHKLWRYVRGIVQKSTVYKTKNMIALSKNNANLINKQLKDLKIFFVDNPINNIKENRIKVENNNVIGYIGRLSEEKGVDLLVKAKFNQRFNIKVIGDGYLKEFIKIKNPKVCITGWLDEVNLKENMKSLRILVVPSRWYEGMPNVVLEAMSMGIPIITSDVCNASEIINNDNNGFIFETDSINSLNNTLKKIDDDELIKKISMNAYKWYWNKDYTLENHVESLINTYEMILKI